MHVEISIDFIKMSVACRIHQGHERFSDDPQERFIDDPQGRADFRQILDF